MTNGQKAYQAWADVARKHQPVVPGWFEIPNWLREAYEASAAAVTELPPAISTVRAALLDAERELSESMPAGASQKRWLTARRLVREAREATDPKAEYVIRLSGDELNDLDVLLGHADLLARAKTLVELGEAITYEFAASDHCVVSLAPGMRALVAEALRR